MGYYLRKNVNTFTVRLNLKERSGLKEAFKRIKIKVIRCTMVLKIK